MKKIAIALAIITFPLSFANTACNGDGRETLVIIHPHTKIDFKTEVDRYNSGWDRLYTFGINNGQLGYRDIYMGKSLRGGVQDSPYYNVAQYLVTISEKAKTNNHTFEVSICRDRNGYPLIKKAKNLYEKENDSDDLKKEIAQLKSELKAKETESQTLKDIIMAFASGGNGCEEINESSLSKTSQESVYGEKVQGVNAL